MDIPVGEAHVEVEVPPGSYMVRGHVCEPGINDYTDQAIVMAGCNQEICVDLIVAKVKTCVIRDIHPFVREARLAGVPDRDIRIATSTILEAVCVSPEEMAGKTEIKIEAVKDIEEARDVLRDYKATLDILRKTKPR